MRLIMQCHRGYFCNRNRNKFSDCDSSDALSARVKGPGLHRPGGVGPQA